MGFLFLKPPSLFWALSLFWDATFGIVAVFGNGVRLGAADLSVWEAKQALEAKLCCPAEGNSKRPYF